MQFNLDNAKGKFIIRSYETGEIQINDEHIQQSVIVTPTLLINPWQPQDFQELTAQHLQSILTLEPQPSVLLLGTGAKLTFPDTELLAPFYQRGMGVEVMDTAAACRTFMVLLSEDRNVAAALLIR